MTTGPGGTKSPSASRLCECNDNVICGNFPTAQSAVFDANERTNCSLVCVEYGSEVGKFNMIRAVPIDCRGILYVGECSSNSDSNDSGEVMYHQDQYPFVP